MLIEFMKFKKNYNFFEDEGDFKKSVIENRVINFF